MDFDNLKEKLNKKLEEKIPDYQEKKKAISNTIYQALNNETTCPYCGAIIKNGGNFCSSCGKSLKEIRKQEERERVEQEKKREKEYKKEEQERKKEEERERIEQEKKREKEYKKEEQKRKKQEERERMEQEKKGEKEKKQDRKKEEKISQNGSKNSSSGLIGAAGGIIVLVILLALIGFISTNNTSNTTSINMITEIEENDVVEINNDHEQKKVANTSDISTNNTTNIVEKNEIIEPNEEIKKEEKINATPEEKVEESKPQEETSTKSYSKEYYSTNDSSTVKNGNSGKYAYVSKRKNSNGYDIYWIIDFDEKYVYNFTEGNGDDSYERIKIKSGNLNDGLELSYKDSSNEWVKAIHFKYVNTPYTLVIVDNDYFEYEYTTTSIDSALKLKDGKQVYEP